jgi:ABC-type uncharacterized transport system ATPase subunit
MSIPLLQMEDITKVYPGTVANNAVSFAVDAGEIHALVGENGTGKTTLMRVLYGMTTPDRGVIRWRGRPVQIGSSQDAIALGIGMVHQHFMLVSSFTVAENVVLGLREGFPLLNLDAAARRLHRLSDQFGLQVDPWARVSSLSTGEQQRVEILKVLFWGAELLILDEPTAILAPSEVEGLFDVLRGLRAQGHAVVIITHKLCEVLELCDRATVLRDGQTVATVRVRETTREELVRLMVGRDVVQRLDKRPAQPGEVVVRVQNATIRANGHGGVCDVSFVVRAGEVVALAGVAGNGQSSLAEALLGLRRLDAGKITILGQDLDGGQPAALARLGVGRIPEDRRQTGLALGLSACENLLVGAYGRSPYSLAGVLRRREMRRLADQLRSKYSIGASSVDAPARHLSGGNQQKIILARELHSNPRVLIAVNPTRGLDAGTTGFVYEQLLAARSRGAGIVVVSTDLEEVFCLSDRIAVMYAGRLMGEAPTHVLDETRVGLMMTGTPLASLS